MSPHPVRELLTAKRTVSSATMPSKPDSGALKSEWQLRAYSVEKLRY